MKARFAAQPAEHRAFDLVVCSHIDNDHINGLLTLFRRRPDGFRAGDVWFNPRDHLVPDALGTGQGDQLSELLGPARDRWNAAFGGRAVVVPDGGPLPERELTGMTITVLAPGLGAAGRAAGGVAGVPAGARGAGAAAAGRPRRGDRLARRAGQQDRSIPTRARRTDRASRCC